MDARIFKFKKSFHFSSEPFYSDVIFIISKFVKLFDIYATKDFTYKNLKNIIKDENIAVLSGDKDCSIVIMQKNDYNKKLQQMIDEGIRNRIYTPTEDNTLNDL